MNHFNLKNSLLSSSPPPPRYLLTYYLSFICHLSFLFHPLFPKFLPYPHLIVWICGSGFILLTDYFPFCAILLGLLGEVVEQPVCISLPPLRRPRVSPFPSNTISCCSLVTFRWNQCLYQWFPVILKLIENVHFKLRKLVLFLGVTLIIQILSLFSKYLNLFSCPVCSPLCLLICQVRAGLAQDRELKYALSVVV